LSVLKKIITIGLGDIVGSGITVIFWLYLASIVNPDEYGQIHYIISIATFTSTFTLLGTGNALIVFIAKNKDVVKSLISFSIISGGIILIISILFSFFNVGFLIFGIIIFVYGISRDLAKKDFKKYSINIISHKALTAILAFIGWQILGVDGVIYGISLSYFVYFRYIFEDLKNSKLSFYELRKNIHEIKNNKKFIFSNYSLQITSSLTTQADKLLIVPILGLALLGNYSLALQIIALLIMVPSIIFKFLIPHYIDGEISNNLKRNSILLSFVFVALGVIVSPIIIPELFPNYTNVISLIQIMSFAVIPITINHFFFAAFLAKENGKIPLFGGIISSSIMLSGMIILGNIFEETGVAITYVMSFSILCLFYSICSRKSRQT
tara:strand:+ start:27865 stop:29007 length:1143 start_codon:yes stop_codon:yes gene_type:complete